MVTSRSVPQQTAQIFSPFAGQNRAAFRFSQIGQNTESPMIPCGRSAEYAAGTKSTKRTCDRVRNVKIQSTSRYPKTLQGVRSQERPGLNRGVPRSAICLR